jgi:branched-chain amino acid transport system ATP-binding protein
MSAQPMPASPLLEVQDLSVRFGGIVALNGVSFSVQPCSITALIGPNGAGKTTVFNCITGFYRAHSGRILLRGQQGATDLTDELRGFFGGTHRVARAGVARTFQNIRLFSEMSVIENLLVAQHTQLNRNILSGFLTLPSFRRSEAAALERAHEWLRIVGLESQGNQLAGSLSYGNQRRLEIARAMCTRPRIICLDEPAAGLNPRETDELSVLIRRLRSEFDVTVFVIEHDMSLVMGISEHVIVLNYGQVIAAAGPKEIQQDPKVLAAYLGTEDPA